MTTHPCPASAIWPEIGPHGARLRCSLLAGHDGPCLASEIEYLEESA